VPASTIVASGTRKLAPLTTAVADGVR